METLALTDTSNARPAQSPPESAPRKVRAPKDPRAPKGVEALNKAMCFLHFERDIDVPSRDVDKARAVGADSITSSQSSNHISIPLTLVYYKRKKNYQRQL